MPPSFTGINFTEINALGQKLDREVPGWTARECPPRTSMIGHFCRVVPLDLDLHAADLFAANRLDLDGRNWTYLPYGPFDDLDTYRQWVASAAVGDDPLFHAIVDLKTDQAVGVASFMRIDPTQGVIETGHLNYSPLLQRQPAATEAMYLLMRRVFDELGYRRYEWKCHALNEPSSAAALRLGFTYEGLFRQAAVVKGRNRDTLWYSIIDSEWPAIKQAYEVWLSPPNFDARGQQKHSLAYLISSMRAIRL
jgi:RimJ/RimL family protein N-acetyltransferase